MTTENTESIMELIAGVTEGGQRAAAGTLDYAEAVEALVKARRLVEALSLRAYPMGGHADETKEQVVVTVHGVDVSVRGREHDLVVQIDDTDRDGVDREKYPLCVEVFGDSEHG